MSLGRIFLWTVIGSLGFAALLAIAVVIFEWRQSDRLLGSVTLFGLFSLNALLCSVVLDKRRLVWFMWSGIGFSGASLVVWLILIWYERSMRNATEEFTARGGGTLTTLAVLSAHVGLLKLLRFERPLGRRVQAVTIWAGGTLAAYGIILLWGFELFEQVIDDDILFRIFIVLIIVAATATVVTPVLHRVQRPDPSFVEGAMSRRVFVEVRCPRCRGVFQHRCGDTHCPECRLRINVEVEEPACLCGYLLYRLESDRCPECGREVPLVDRWMVETTPGDDPISCD